MLVTTRGSIPELSKKLNVLHGEKEFIKETVHDMTKIAGQFLTNQLYPESIEFVTACITIVHFLKTHKVYIEKF